MADDRGLEDTCGPERRDPEGLPEAHYQPTIDMPP